MIWGNLAAPFALAVGLGALVSFASAPAFATGADDEPDVAFAKSSACLKNPRGAAPAGERWRYRVERGSKRHCWYTRADGQRKTVVQRAPQAKPVKNTDTPNAEPLQLSVANARAEADLSAPPLTIEAPPVTEPRNPAWTLAERWSQNSNASPPVVQAQPAPVRQPPAAEPPEMVEVAEQDSGLLEITAGAVALLGLSVVLIATLMRRRKRERPVREWVHAQRDIDDAPEAPLTDLNEAPLMTWRKTSKDRLQTMRRSAELRDATSARNAQPSPTGSAGLRRTPTIPPGAHA